MADGERIGWLAAERMQTLLAGGVVQLTTVVPPKGLVERRSTETVAVADKLVASAVACLRERISDPPDSRELAAYLGVSVRTLEGRFKRELRETPYQYQLRLRIEHAKALLRETHKTNMEIALASGFRSETRFEQAFKRITGRRPSQYREA
jgi:transcriptional regulator GlxA family with amidase domain